MIEKVNPMHPDKIADRIAGAIVDLAYKTEDNPKVAVEVLIGHGMAHVIVETSYEYDKQDIAEAVYRISGIQDMTIAIHRQDAHLANNQNGKIRCGDNGIFKGMPITEEQKELSSIARHIHGMYGTDGKYILNGRRLIICQSNATTGEILNMNLGNYTYEINPLGYWTGGTDVDTGATNRKLGSDMGDAVTGGGLHGKDLSKADVSLNIYAFLKAQQIGEPVEMCCAIGDEMIDGVPYGDIVEIAREFIRQAGGFEKFAEWGLF